MKHWKSLFCSLVGLTLAATASAHAAEFVVNGDFSAGNTGFTTNYNLSNLNPYFSGGVHGIYQVLADSAIAGQASYGDWTNTGGVGPSGNPGFSFVADGATDLSQNPAWQETVNGLMPNHDYTFSFYAIEVSSDSGCCNALMEASINGTPVGTNLGATGAWAQYSTVWHSGANTSVTLSISDLNTSGSFNDFALTDISFTGVGAVPEPSTWAMMLIGFAGLGFAGYRQTRRNLDTA